MPEQAENVAVRAEASEKGPSAGGFPPSAPIFLTKSGEVTTLREEAATIIQSARRRPVGPGESVQPELLEFFYPFMRGKLCVLLAVGLSDEETANWAEHEAIIITKMREQDTPFAADLATCKAVARLYPLLRVYMTSAESWRAAEWLGGYLQARQGKCGVDEMLAYMARRFAKIRPSLAAEADRRQALSDRLPIGDFNQGKKHG